MFISGELHCPILCKLEVQQTFFPLSYILLDKGSQQCLKCPFHHFYMLICLRVA
jgi:hypothetical protein